MARQKKMDTHLDEDLLVLGWDVDDDWAPKYWKSETARSGRQSPSDLITSTGKSVGCHSIIVASSGSGKSFFLGRLLEEILLRTQSRLVVFDPNSDFRKLSKLLDQKYWRKAKFDPKKESFLPHEFSRGPITRRWKGIEIRVYVSSKQSGDGLTPIQFNWLHFPVDWFSDDSDFASQSEMRHCHRFVNAYHDLMIASKTTGWRGKKVHSLLEMSMAFCHKFKGSNRAAIRKNLAKQFAFDADGTNFNTNDGRLSNPTVENFNEQLEPLLDRASRALSLVSETTIRAYFGAAEEAKDSGIFAKRISPPPPSDPVRVHVVDLPSIDQRQHRLMAVSKFLDDELVLARQKWREALGKERPEDDERTPTFIVVDEAHNLIPEQSDSSSTRRLREQFRTIAAEGRKFGLFLILVSQRPDKLDPMVISECENRAIMKMNSDAVLSKAGELLGVSSAAKEHLDQCLKLEPGRALLFGPWAEHKTKKLYGAMRRTKEGGRNLRVKFWATRRAPKRNP